MGPELTSTFARILALSARLAFHVPPLLYQVDAYISSADGDEELDITACQFEC